uniref:Cyclic-phosphate processing Receiver domain-containing protein n=1 Tax=Rhizobium phage LG08 TaxID=3129229 RepID=A0AAU8HY45_9CAUD
MSYISFDHDLGIGKNGYDAAKILVETDMSCDGKYLSEDFDFYVHSQNPIGKKNIETFMNGYLNFKKSGEMK